MRTTQDYAGGRDYTSAPALEGEPRGVGWIVFAAVMLGLVGFWNILEGIAAIANAHVYIADARYVFSDLNTWGWIILLVGVLQAFAALTLMTGSEFARWFGIASAGINAIGNLAFVPAYPWWAISMFAVDVLIIYGLAVYGGGKLRSML